MSASAAPNTFLLVSGASLGAWIWDDVRRQLSAQSEVVELTGRNSPDGRRAFTLERGVAELAARIDATHGQVVLVGHSIGGLLALGAAHLRPERIARVVLIGTHVPEAGKSHLSLAPAPVRVVLGLVFRMSRDGVRAPASALRAEYAEGLDAKTAERIVAEATREPARLFTDPWSGATAPAGVAVTYVRLTEDHAVPPAVQTRSAERVRAEVRDLATGHLPMLSRPRELAALLEG